LFHRKLLANAGGIEENDPSPSVAMINLFKSSKAVLFVMSPLLVDSQRYIKFLPLTGVGVLNKIPTAHSGYPSRMII
jgi:hypothetical protein